MNKKRMSIMLCGMLLVSGLFISTARAENSIGTNDVTGNEYVCFFVSTVDIFSSQVSFTQTGGLTISSFGGYGFYLRVTTCLPARIFAECPYWSPHRGHYYAAGRLHL